MIEVLMVDDHTIFRSGVRRLLSDEPDMRVVLEASNGVEALEHLRKRAFGVVILDVNMGGRSGFETLRRIHAEWPSQAVIMLSMYSEAQYAQVAFDAGAKGYLSKDRDAVQLVAAIRIAAGGGYYLQPGLLTRQIMPHKPVTERSAYEKLTEREWQILRLIVEGVTLTEIGVRLCLSVKTISTYRTRILEKLALANNAELIRYCLEKGIAD